MQNIDLPSVGKGETIHNQVYLILRRELMNGHIKPGQSISIRYLIDQFGVSTTPAREAIKRLQAERALIVGPNRAPIVPLPTLNGLRDLRDIRMSLEGLATEKSAALISKEELDSLEEHCQKMFEAITEGNNDQYLESNWAFHSVIYMAAQSELMMDIIKTLWMRAGPLITLALHNEIHKGDSMVQHSRALKALKRGDPVAARAAIEADIGGAAADLESILQE